MNNQAAIQALKNLFDNNVINAKQFADGVIALNVQIQMGKII